MNETFDSAINAAKDIAQTAGKKAEQLIEISKVKIQITQINGSIAKTYEKLGSGVYNMKKADYMDESLITSLVSQIDDLIAEREAAKAKLAELKEMVICPECGARNPKNVPYCSYCGNKIKKDEA